MPLGPGKYLAGWRGYGTWGLVAGAGAAGGGPAAQRGGRGAGEPGGRGVGRAGEGLVQG